MHMLVGRIIKVWLKDLTRVVRDKLGDPSVPHLLDFLILRSEVRKGSNVVI